ncbi:hypothetical protein [Exiguobacterium sp. s138]|uniref:hypothetical protein n=1 Tax=Exiguobacterium sp. s138 TaxID=2751202 RepID=UPI001BECD00B|nr:hypothetical protein [Exiguobacterium sp. s138]
MSFTRDVGGLIPSHVISVSYNNNPSVGTADVVKEFCIFKILTKRSNNQLSDFINSPKFQNPELNPNHKSKITKTHNTVSFIVESLVTPSSYSDPSYMREWLHSQNHYFNRILEDDLNNEFDAILFANDITRALSDLQNENEDFFSKTRMAPYLNEEIVPSY